MADSYKQICRCNYTDILFERQNERFISQANAINRSKDLTPDHAPNKYKLSISNSIGMSGKKTHRQKQMLNDSKPMITEFDCGVQQQNSQTLLPLVREYASESNLNRVSQRLPSVNIKPPMVAVNSIAAIKTQRAYPSQITSGRFPPSYGSRNINLSKLTTATANDFESQKNPSAMLFTNYLKKQRHLEHLKIQSNVQMNSDIASDSTTQFSQLSSREHSMMLRTTHQPNNMILKEVESEYAESAIGDNQRQFNRAKASKFVSKLEKYISHPAKAIESLIVKNLKASEHKQPTGLSNAARFVKSVFGEQLSRIRQH